MTTTDATFLAISDIHFNPFDGLDSAAIQQLVDTPAAGWPKILSGNGSKIPTVPGSRPRADANYALMTTVLDQAKLAEPNPDFIIYPGDFVRHGIWGYRGNPIDTADFESFVKKIVQTVLNEFTSRFPGVPVFMTFGNDDSYASDYGLTENGRFLADLAADCQASLGTAAVNFADFTDTGCYTATLPKLGHRLISVSNVFWSASGQNTHSNSPGDRVAAWLDAELGKAAAADQQVWLLMHIPPGQSGYVPRHATHLHTGANWRHHFDYKFQKAIDAHGAQIDVAFAGHTHMDDIRFISYDRNQITTPLMTKIVPAISPIFGQNPCFQTYSTTGGAISDWSTHYLHNGAWSQYDAATDYGSVDPTQLLTAFRAMRQGDVGAMAYASDYRVHRNPLPQSQIDGFLRLVTAGASNVHDSAVQTQRDGFDIEAAMAESSDGDLS